MWIFILIVVVIIVLFVIGLKRAGEARAGMSVTVNKSMDEVSQIIKKQFSGMLWTNNGSSFTRKASKVMATQFLFH